VVRVHDEDGFFLEIVFGDGFAGLKAWLGDVVDPALRLVGGGDFPFEVEVLGCWDGCLWP